MRYFRPPSTDDPKFDLAVDAVTLSTCRTLESAIAVFDLGDHDSAAALTRKALEFAYVLVILRRKGRAGVELLNTWGAKNMASGLQAMMTAQRGEFHALDRDKVLEAIREYRRIIPNGDVSRVPEKMLADWAGLEKMHDDFYSMLNSHAHFDLYEALSLWLQVRRPNDEDAIGDLNLNRALVAAKIQQVVLLAIHALHEMGAAKMAGVLEHQGPKFEKLSVEVANFSADRATRDHQYGKGAP
jgi:hypothetical protein